MADTDGTESYSAYPERRINTFRPELRSADGSSGPKHIFGYASMFNKLSRKLGGFVERVDNRAFDTSRAEGFPGVVCRFNHNDDFLLGTVAARTCLIDIDGMGLLYDVVPPTFRSDVIELMERGDVTSSSFAFCVPEGGDDWGLSDFGYPLRTLLSLDLRDVAPVTTPAYPDATSAVRSMDGAVNSLAAKFHTDPTEIRNLLDNNQGVRLFKRSDVPSQSKPAEVPEEEPMSDTRDETPYWEEEFRKNYSAAERKKMAAKGHALPDGSYPIADEADLHNAIKTAGMGSAPEAKIHAHIKKRAAALGKTSVLPDSWGGDSEKKSDDTDSEDRAAKAGYQDMETCGDCGATGQYGKHCTECGNSMEPPLPDPGNGKHCQNCGAKMPVKPAKRSEHVCDEEVRADSKPSKDDEDEDEDEADTEGDAPEEDSAPSDAEVRDTEAEAGRKAKLPGKDMSDKVRKGEDQLAAAGLQRRMIELLGKRDDPYVDQD